MSKSKGGPRAAAAALTVEPAPLTPALRARGAAWLASLFADPSSLAAQTAAAYGELLDEALLDVRGRQGSPAARVPATCVARARVSLWAGRRAPAHSAEPAPSLPTLQGWGSHFGASS